MGISNSLTNDLSTIRLNDVIAERSDDYELTDNDDELDFSISDDVKAKMPLMSASLYSGYAGAMFWPRCGDLFFYFKRNN
ncbi:MAG: hypothetical protein HQK49_17140 [Oligoflexia bacterium]|nr:hypothetical protein [Oligoflexia bacterium]